MFIERPPKWFRLLFPGALFRLPAAKGENPRVFLTFDDGPIPTVTPWVLDTLDKYDVKATFFMVGQNIERYPQLFEEVIKRGHTVGNHTLHHIRGMGISSSDYLKDCKHGEKLTGSRILRPPHGWLTPAQFRAVKKNYRIVMYDLVTRDYSKRLTADDVFENVKKLTRDGSIIVFHDSVKSFPRLEKALPVSLEWLISEGYRFRTL